MSAATTAIDTPERSGDVIQLPIAAATVIYAGTLVALNSSGNAVPAADTAGLRVIGRAEETVDNTDGDAGDLTVDVKRGVFRMANSGTNAVDADDKGKIMFVEDDSTAAETSTNKVAAGRVIDVDDDGVWIDTRAAGVVPTALTALAALGSTNGTAGAAADLAALKAEAELIGDDVRAIHATLTTVLTALAAARIAN